MKIYGTLKGDVFATTQGNMRLRAWLRLEGEAEVRCTLGEVKKDVVVVLNSKNEIVVKNSGSDDLRAARSDG